MTASEVGAVPDDVIEEVAQAIEATRMEWYTAPVDPTDNLPGVLTRAALSVPSVAEVFARDAKVRKINSSPLPDDMTRSAEMARRYFAVAALYSEDGTR